MAAANHPPVFLALPVLAGVLIMESLEHAQKRGANIICEYLGGELGHGLQACRRASLPRSPMPHPRTSVHGQWHPSIACTQVCGEPRRSPRLLWGQHMVCAPWRPGGP